MSCARPARADYTRRDLTTFLARQLTYVTTDREARGNLRALARYLAFLLVLVTLYAVLFLIIKQTVEHENHSWITGFSWA